MLAAYVFHMSANPFDVGSINAADYITEQWDIIKNILGASNIIQFWLAAAIQSIVLVTECYTNFQEQIHNKARTSFSCGRQWYST